MNKIIFFTSILYIHICVVAKAQSIEWTNYLGVGIGFTKSAKLVYVPSELGIYHQVGLSAHTGLTYITPKNYVIKVGTGSSDIHFGLRGENLLTDLQPAALPGEYASSGIVSMSFGTAFAPHYTYLNMGKRVYHKKLSMDFSLGIANIRMPDYYITGGVYRQSIVSSYDNFEIYSTVATNFPSRNFGLSSQIQIEYLLGKKQRSSIGLQLLGIKGFDVISNNVFRCVLNDVPYKFDVDSKGSVAVLHLSYKVRVWQKKIR
jgi:hypothetical protein